MFKLRESIDKQVWKLCWHHSYPAVCHICTVDSPKFICESMKRTPTKQITEVLINGVCTALGHLDFYSSLMGKHDWTRYLTESFDSYLLEIDWCEKWPARQQSWHWTRSTVSGRCELPKKQSRTSLYVWPDCAMISTMVLDDLEIENIK